MVLAPFLVQPKPVPLPLGEVVFHLHPQYGTDPSKGVEHDRNEGAIAEFHQVKYIDAAEEQRHCNVIMNSVHLLSDQNAQALLPAIATVQHKETD